MIQKLKNLKNMKKVAGVLDPIQKNLSVDVWTNKMELRPELRKNILDAIEKVTPLSNVEGAWIIGSITGYKYTETSDIDINVSVYEFNQSQREVAKQLSGKMTHSGRHDVNLFIKETSGTVPNWQDSFFGVYDIIKNDWVNLPPRRKLFRDPELEFKMELLTARQIAKDFNQRVQQFKSNLSTLSKLKKIPWVSPGLSNYYYERKRNQLKEQLTKLIEMAHALEDDRKMEYTWGWGIPRKNFRNLVYKIIEHGPYGKLFLILEKIPLENEFGSDDMLQTQPE